MTRDALGAEPAGQQAGRAAGQGAPDQPGDHGRIVRIGHQPPAVRPGPDRNPAEGDLEGLAEAWLSAGRLRFWAGAPGSSEALERAAACARQSGNHHAEQESRTWLAATLWDLPIPVDVAVGRAQRMLKRPPATHGTRRRYSIRSR